MTTDFRGGLTTRNQFGEVTILALREAIMHRSILAGAILAAAVTAMSAAGANAQQFIADLKGVNEIGSIPSAVTITTTPSTVATGYTGAVLSNGTGTTKLVLNKMASTVTYKLTYSNVGTTAPQTGTVSQAHIHFAKSRDSGGFLLFFSPNLTPPAGVPPPQACPVNSGTVTGTWTKANIVAIPGQNVVAQNFDALAAALESNTAYANIHTIPLPGATNTAYPAGEIRGQVHKSDRDENHDNQDHNDNHAHN